MQWSVEKANQWYSQLDWLCGFNYLPRNAVNFTEMWQSEGFNTRIIEEELFWAKKCGFNILRTNIPYIVWKKEGSLLLERIKIFLSIAARHAIHVMLCPFDDCGFSGDQPFAGAQKAPVKGLHNSQAAASPGRLLVLDRSVRGELKEYITALLTEFKNDERIIIWDLYNEPGNDMIFTLNGEIPFTSGDLFTASYELLKDVFAWARAVNTVQPLTVGGWKVPPVGEVARKDLYNNAIDELAFSLSDIISFHAYCSIDMVGKIVEKLKLYNRPMLCTEWLARHIGSNYGSHLPFFHKHNIAAIQWGLVKGRTQTYIPWPEIKKNNADWDKLWFHDFLHGDGNAYEQSELELLQLLRYQRGRERNV